MGSIGPEVYIPIAAAMSAAIGVLWKRVLTLQDRIEALLREVLVAIASQERVD